MQELFDAATRRSGSVSGLGGRLRQQVARLGRAATVAACVAFAACAGTLQPSSWASMSPPGRSACLVSEFGVQPRFMRLDAAIIRFVDVGPLAAARPSERTPWLLVHGLGGGLGDFAPVALAAATDHRVIALDLPGFGESVSLNDDYRITAFVGVLHEFLAALTLPEVHLVCHSLGGQICMALALEDAAVVRSLTLIDAAGAYDASPFLQAFTRQSARINIGRPVTRPDRAFTKMALGDQSIFQRLFVRDPFRLTAMASLNENYRGLVQRLRVPTLVIWGETDPLFATDSAFFLKENIRGATLHIAAGAAHSPQLERPTQVLAWIEAFHARLSGGGTCRAQAP
jgi:pimeloyl-ACP methyl ester carboxylesterase